jgi:acetyltransferase-like isoleucine patch superfamily enzyme
MATDVKTREAERLCAEGLEGIVLQRTTEAEYCRAAMRTRHNEFWWYYNGLVPFRGHWKPFEDRTGRWWYHVKPGFAWPVDYFTPISNVESVFPPKLLLGWQCPVPEAQEDSKVWLNVIHDLAGYDISRVASNKRRAVRKGFRELKIEIVDPADPELAQQACEVWNSHVERTGWNTTMGTSRFVNTWRELARWPGTTVMTARDPNMGNMLCAWLIARVIDNTVYVDTIASHTERLAHRPNDTIIFQCLTTAARMGIAHAHYSLKSKLESLEAFKQSLGFTAYPFPSRLKLRWPIGPILRLARPEIYMRLEGDPVWSETDARRPSLTLPGLRARAPVAEQPALPGRLLPDLKAWPREEVAQIADSWYVPPLPPQKSGWVVYSLDFVLATLQGSITEPKKVRRTPFWLAVGVIVRGVMAVAQALLMGLTWLPVVSTFIEIVARTFTRNAAGFFLRSCYWKARLKSLGSDTLIDQGVEIWGPANVSIGSNCHIDTNVRLAAGERRHGQRGSISIGNYVHLGPGVHIAGRGGVVIHDFVGLSAHTHLYSATNTIEFPGDPGQLISMSHMAPPDQQYIIENPITIEPYAFVGMMARVMPGVRIGYGAVVHAAMELTRDVPPFANISGPPRARQIGWRKPRRRSRHLGSDGNGSSTGQDGPPRPSV